MAESPESKESRIYTIPLRRAWASPRHHRAVRAVNLIKAFAQRHMKGTAVRIDPTLNAALWRRGIRFPPRRVSVEMNKDEDGVIVVSLVGEQKPPFEVPEHEAEGEEEASAATTGEVSAAGSTQE